MKERHYVIMEFISVCSLYTGTAEKKLQKLMFKKYTLQHTLVHTHVCGAYINRNNTNPYNVPVADTFHSILFY